MLNQDEQRERELFLEVVKTAKETLAYYGRAHSRVTRRLDNDLVLLENFQAEMKKLKVDHDGGKEL